MDRNLRAVVRVNVIGVDPGLHGALALLDGGTIVVEDMPVLDGRVDPWALTRILVGWGAVERVAVEVVSTRPGQAAQATLHTGINWGVIVGVLAVLERPTVDILPSRWTAQLGLPRAGKTAAERRAAKEARRMRAKALWPAQADLFARVKDDGRADAALLAEWCRRNIEPNVA